MTNGDRIRNMTDEQLSALFCDAMETITDNADVDCCLNCPVKALCRKGRNGFLEYLKREAEDN